jgi:hypothetical protein
MIVLFVISLNSLINGEIVFPSKGVYLYGTQARLLFVENRSIKQEAIRLLSATYGS